MARGNFHGRILQEHSCSLIRSGYTNILSA
jgi:hypothetical protein